MYPCDVTKVTSPFGERGSKYHSGTDFATPLHSDIIFIDDVELVYLQFDKNGYGNYAVFDSLTQERSYLYAHLDHIPNLKIGSVFKTGERLTAITGNSGGSTGPHLHFEVRECYFDSSVYFKYEANGPKWKAIDPMTVILSDELTTEEIIENDLNSKEFWKKYVISCRNLKSGRASIGDIETIMNASKYVDDLFHNLHYHN